MSTHSDADLGFWDSNESGLAGPVFLPEPAGLGARSEFSSDVVSAGMTGVLDVVPGVFGVVPDFSSHLEWMLEGAEQHIVSYQVPHEALGASQGHFGLFVPGRVVKLPESPRFRELEAEYFNTIKQIESHRFFSLSRVPLYFRANALSTEAVLLSTQPHTMNAVLDAIDTANVGSYCK